MQSIRISNILSQVLFHCVTDGVKVLINHTKSGRPTPAKYKHFRTIRAHSGCFTIFWRVHGDHPCLVLPPAGEKKTHHSLIRSMSQNMFQHAFPYHLFYLNRLKIGGSWLGGLWLRMQQANVMKGMHQKPISVFPSHCLTTQEGKHHSFQPQPTLIQKVAHAPPFNVLKYTQKQRGTNKMKERLHPVKAQNFQTVTKSKDSDKPGSTQKGHVAHVPSSFCDTEAHHQTISWPHAFISWHNISMDALPHQSSKQ